MKLYFCTHDGNLRKVFKSLLKATEWKNKGSLYFVAEVEYDDNRNIIKVDGQSFNDFIESMLDIENLDEFNRVKNYFSTEYRFYFNTDD